MRLQKPNDSCSHIQQRYLRAHGWLLAPPSSPDMCLQLMDLPLPSQTASSALRHSNPSPALCFTVVLAIYLVVSFLVAPLPQICALVSPSPVLRSSPTSCAASGLGRAM